MAGERARAGTRGARSAPACGALVATLVLLPGLARGHAIVDEGRRLYEEADFVGALDAFARAEVATDLTAGDLVDLYEVRALVHLAMGDGQAMQLDLARLVALAPDHSLDPRTTPEARRALAAARAASSGPLRLMVDTASGASGVTVRGQASGDPGGLVRGLRIRGRTAGGSWQEAIDVPLVVATARGVVEYYAELIGPGGAVLAASGSASEPLASLPAAATSAEPTEDRERESRRRRVGLGVGLGVGLAALAAGVVLTAVLLTTGRREPDTDLAPFAVRF